MLDFQKKKQLCILVQIARVDEDFDDEEKAVIRKLGESYGATTEEVNEIMESPSISESLAPMDMMDKMNFMMDCIMVVLADDVVTNSEEYFANQIANKLGFNKDVVAFLIKNKDSNREEMYELMLPYLST